MAKDKPTLPTAYSYIRFSHPDQAKGDSLRRQTEAAAEWCKVKGVTLDASTTLHDLGKSAFLGKHRENPDRHALAAFLKLAEGGRIPTGSYLLIENLDRLSREEEVPACHLLTSILMKGIKVVQMMPSEMLLTDKSNGWELMRAVMELSRGHNESAVKSKRVGDRWAEKKAEARASGSVQTTRTPAWLEVVGRVRYGKQMKGGTFRLIRERVKVVRRMFDLAEKGQGLSLIVKWLTANAAPWGRGQKWSKSYVRIILKGRAVLGEYQPRRLAKPEGEPILNYYPAVPGIDEEKWQRVQAALASRRDNPGRIGKKVASLFTGLLWDVATKSRMQIALQTRGIKGKSRHRARVLVSADSQEGRAPSRSFPYPVFESAILSLLKEVRAADILGEEEEKESESVCLAVELGQTEQQLAAIESELMEGGDVATLAKAARKLEAKRDDLRRRLAVAQQKEANPVSTAWAEAGTLLDAVQSHEENRLRLRGLLRRIISAIWVCIVTFPNTRPSNRVAMVEISFVGGATRHYAIRYWSAGFCRKGGWWACSITGEEDPERVLEMCSNESVGQAS